MAVNFVKRPSDQIIQFQQGSEYIQSVNGHAWVILQCSVISFKAVS